MHSNNAWPACFNVTNLLERDRDRIIVTRQDTQNILLKDPLSEVTRKERRMLLGMSMLGIALVKTGLVPTKISALGVEFDKTSQQSLFVILCLITFYFAVVFLVYAAADFLTWRQSLIDFRIQRKRNDMAISSDHVEEEVELRYQKHVDSEVLYMFAVPVSILRALLEFLLPIVVSIYAVFTLWFAGRI